LFSAQTTCNQGIGKVVYERLPDQQLQGFDDDVVSFQQFGVTFRQINIYIR
jgi:hypothetical protein